jgi:hypothetical protein
MKITNIKIYIILSAFFIVCFFSSLCLHAQNKAAKPHIEKPNAYYEVLGKDIIITKCNASLLARPEKLREIFVVTHEAEDIKINGTTIVLINFNPKRIHDLMYEYSIVPLKR